MPIDLAAPSRLRQGLNLLALSLVCLVLWPTVLMTPLKILVVFFHEGSHALATVLSGGEVIAMEIVPEQGGSVLSRGGSAVLIASSGYLGSLVIGGLLLVLAARVSFDRWIMAVLGLAMALLTVLYVRNLYGVAFGIGGAALAFSAARWLSHAANDLLLRLIGLTSMLYVPLDIFSDTLARSHLRSDASILAELLGGSSQFWGAIWLAIALLIIPVCVWLSLRPTPSQLVKHADLSTQIDTRADKGAS